MAASRFSTSDSSTPPSGSITSTTGSPRVTTPVLSKATAVAPASSSSTSPPFTSTPARAAEAIAATMVTGVEITSAQGQAMRMVTRAR